MSLADIKTKEDQITTYNAVDMTIDGHKIIATGGLGHYLNKSHAQNLADKLDIGQAIWATGTVAIGRSPSGIAVELYTV